MTRRAIALALSLSLAAIVPAATAVPAGAAVAGAPIPNPEVSGPVTGGLHGFALWDAWFDLSEIGYRDDEYFVSGTATAEDGTTAPYTTRIIVTRPVDQRRFSGTVMLDWVNVTAQFENAVDSVEAHEFLFREGWAFVHVSAQAAGVCCTPLTPMVWDPVRYGALDHPGDEFANSMFSQIARAIDRPRGVDPLGGLRGPRRLIAAGQSQSASRLDDYVRSEQPRARVIDGFLIHGGGSKEHPKPPAVPVLHLLSDAEAGPTAPNQSRNYRLWEIAGTSHSDFWIGYHQVVGQGPRFAGGPRRPASAEDEVDLAAGNYGEQPHPLHATCVLAGGAMPMHYSVSAALHHLDRWIRRGTPPPRGPRFGFEGDALARDADGNAIGGIRLPPIDVPVAEYVSDACVLGGYTVPFTDLELQARYPSHEAYLSLMRARTRSAVRAGFLLPEDARDLLARAGAIAGRWDPIPGN